MSAAGFSRGDLAMLERESCLVDTKGAFTDSGACEQACIVLGVCEYYMLRRIDVELIAIWTVNGLYVTFPSCLKPL